MLENMGNNLGEIMKMLKLGAVIALILAITAGLLLFLLSL